MIGLTEKTIFEQRLEEAEGVCYVDLWEELVEEQGGQGARRTVRGTTRILEAFMRVMGSWWGVPSRGVAPSSSTGCCHLEGELGSVAPCSSFSY